jgi:uncharacterized membrane protein HdeD (DUF308 family)
LLDWTKGGFQEMSIFKKFGVISGLLMIAVGILFYVYKTEVTQFLAVITGLAVLIIGVYNILFAVITWKSSNRLPVLLVGILLAAVGAFLLLNNQVTIFIAGVSIGAIAFLAGIDRFRSACRLIRARLGGGYAVLSGCVQIIFGILMCIAPGYGISVLVMLIGVYLIVSGLMILISCLKFHDL